jgi:excisionase family DNA binding protein
MERNDYAPTPLQSAALTIPAAGTYLGVSSDTIRRLVRAGTIPHARIGSSIRIRRTDLEAYLDGQTTRQWQPVDGRGQHRDKKPRVA